MILISVIIRIYLSRAADKSLGGSGVDFINKLRKGKTTKDMLSTAKFIKKRSSKISKIASRKYGKGRRGANTWAKQASAK